MHGLTASVVRASRCWKGLSGALGASCHWYGRVRPSVWTCEVSGLKAHASGIGKQLASWMDSFIVDECGELGSTKRRGVDDAACR